MSSLQTQGESEEVDWDIPSCVWLPELQTPSVLPKNLPLFQHVFT